MILNMLNMLAVITLFTEVILYHFASASLQLISKRPGKFYMVFPFMADFNESFKDNGNMEQMTQNIL